MGCPVSGSRNRNLDGSHRGVLGLPHRRSHGLGRDAVHVGDSVIGCGLGYRERDPRRSAAEVIDGWQERRALDGGVGEPCNGLGGGVSEAGELLIGPARAAFEKGLTGGGYRPQVYITQAALGPDAGIVGAADLARRAGAA